MIKAFHAKRDLPACLALFVINATICGPLFRIAYLDQLQSNEGTFITFAHFLIDHWPHVKWFPWFNAGMPFENTYLPMTSFATAVMAAVAHCSPARAFHILAALAYSLAPVFWYLFAAKVSGRRAASFAAALIWSLFSPSIIIPRIIEDMGTPWGVRRLHNIVYYGEPPHNVALCLLPVALLLVARYLEFMTARRFALAALASAAVMASNAFGIVTVAMSPVMLWAALTQRRWRQLAGIGGILIASYLAICRFLTPTLLSLLRTNSQLVGGDYRFTPRRMATAAVFVMLLAVLWLAMRRLQDPILRFAILFTACFGGVTVLSVFDISFLPQPERYHLEMEIGICLTVAFAAARAVPVLLRREIIVLGSVAVLAAGWLFLQDYRYARRLIRPAGITQSVPFREARWMAAHLPGQRVFASGEDEWWVNLFTDNPQLSAGHEPSAPNFMQRVAVFTIRTGQNAGAQDAEISILWLKAFGCGAITVAGPDSRDPYHGILNPGKFEGLLPLAWREDGNSIYQVPLRSASLAHVIPASAVVSRRPVHGLDVEQVRGYVAALEDASIPPAELTWENPDHGRIAAKSAPGRVISVQISFDPGWQAYVAGRRVPVRSDQLGLMIIDSQCSGDCTVDIAFRGGAERSICLVVSLLVVCALTAALGWNTTRV